MGDFLSFDLLSLFALFLLGDEPTTSVRGDLKATLAEIFRHCCQRLPIPPSG